MCNDLLPPAVAQCSAVALVYIHEDTLVNEEDEAWMGGVQWHSQVKCILCVAYIEECAVYTV